MIKKPARAIVAAIDAAAARWSSADFPPRLRARESVQARTGYPPAAIDYAFDRLFGELRGEAIEAVIIDELGSLDVLDGFVTRTRRPAAFARALGRVCIISSRTTIGVAIAPAIFALCAKCDVLVKDREDGLIAAFFETLAHELPELGESASACPWRGDADAVDLGEFDLVVAFGSDQTLEHLAVNVRPPARLISFGSKASVGYIAREALADVYSARAIAAGAARDIVLYESEGCLSLHALFVETAVSVSPARFAQLLAGALNDAATEFAPARDDVLAAAAIAAARDLATFRASPGIHTAARAEYLAVVDPPFDEPPLFLPRTIAVRSVDDPSQAATYLARHAIALEALALAGSRLDLRELAVATGAARIAPFGSLQAPPLGVFHGGRPRIAEFVRWIGDET
jgi:hypothetical protein